MTDTTLNTKPIYSSAPIIQWGTTDGNGGATGPLKTANTAKDGTGTVLTVFTADVSNGGRVEKLKIRAAGTNTATVLRVFINNGSTNGTASNNVLYTEITVAATTLSETSALADLELPLSLSLPAGYKLNVTLGTTIAAGVYITTVAGKY